MTLGGAASANALSDLKAGETKTIPTKDVIEALGDFGYKGGNSVKEVNAALGELGFKSSGNSGKMVIKGTKQSVATMDYIYSGDDPGEDKKGEAAHLSQLLPKELMKMVGIVMIQKQGDLLNLNN